MVEGVLEGYWYIACRSRELRQRPVPRTLLGKSVVLFRGPAGQPAALEDRCAHRNAPLSFGRTVDGQLQCPYHGWRYRVDGALAEIPALAEAGAVPDNVRVPSFPCVEQEGYVWVCLHRKSALVRPLGFPHLGEQGWTSFQMCTRFYAPVEACLENFLDCPHASSVHRFWFRTPTQRTVRVIVRALPDGAEAEYFDEPRERSVVWWTLAPKRRRMRHTDRFIAPATTRVDYVFSNGAHYIITSSCTPVSDDITDVYTVITFRHHWLGPLIRLFFEPLSRWIIRQDVHILGQVQNNIARFGGQDFHSSDADLLTAYIWGWRRAICNGEDPPAAGSEKHVTIRL